MQLRQKNSVARAGSTMLLILLVMLGGLETSTAVTLVPAGMGNLFEGESAEHKRIFNLLKQNQFDQVIEQAEKVLQENPNDPKAILLIGLAQAGRGNDRQAMEQADRAGHIELEYKAEILASLGKYYAVKKRYFMALLCFDSALKIERNVEIERQVAAIYMVRGQTSRAKVLYEKLLDQPVDYLNLARIYLKDGEYKNAVQFAEQAISVDNATIGEYLLLANCYLLNKQLSEAERTYRLVLSKEPDILHAYHALGLIEIIQQNYEAALEMFSEAIKRASRLREALICRAAVFQIKGLLSQAEADAVKAIDSDPSDFLGHLVLGNIMISAGNYTRANQEYEQASALFIDFALPHFSVSDYFSRNLSDIPVMFTIAHIFYREGLDHFAIEVLDGAGKQSILINPFLALSKARALLRLGEEERSKSLIQKVIEDRPQTVSGLVDMGDLATLQKNYHRAAEFYHKAVKTAPEVMRLRLMLGDTYNQIQQTDLAIEAYKAAISISPETAICYNQLAWTLAEKKNKLEEAITFARKAIQYAPEDPNIIDTLAWIYYRMGKFKEALNIYSQIKNKSSFNSTMFYHQGMIYLKLELNEKAIEMFERALDLSDDFFQADLAKKHLMALWDN